MIHTEGEEVRYFLGEGLKQRGRRGCQIQQRVGCFSHTKGEEVRYFLEEGLKFVIRTLENFTKERPYTFQQNSRSFLPKISVFGGTYFTWIWFVIT